MEMEMEMEMETKKRKIELIEEEEAFSGDGDGDEEKKKKIYLHLGKSDSAVTTGWVVVDPLFTSIEEAELMKSMPTKLQVRRGYAKVVWNSKIFFIGGEFWDENDPDMVYSPRDFSKEVVAFDLVTQTWEDDSTYPNLQSGRMAAEAIVADNRIFVFGTIVPSLLQNEHFGEYLDLSSSNEKRYWRYIPKPPTDLCEVGVGSIAVCNSVGEGGKGEKHHFLFWAFPYGCFFILDYHSLEWQTVEHFFGYPYSPLNSNPYFIIQPHMEPYWNKKVVVLDDAVFWHYGGKIYAHDFKKKTPNATAVCTFEDPSSTFVDAALLDRHWGNHWGNQFPYSYLISQGEGRLSLIWDAFEGNSLYYCKNFCVKRIADNKTLVVHEIEGFAKLTPPSSNFADIRDVLLI